MTKLDYSNLNEPSEASPKRKVLISASIGTAILLALVGGLFVWRPVAGLVAGVGALLTLARIWMNAIQCIRELNATDREVHRAIAIGTAIARHKATGEKKSETGSPSSASRGR